MNIIAFDIEATENKEMLELSIVSYPGEIEIYHSYFCPPYSRSWPKSERVHHITPLDVCDAPTVKEEKATIQRILDNADVMVGYALDNDLNFLSDNGFNIPDNVTAIDVQEYMCVLEDGNNGISLGHTPSLETAAEMMECGFSDDLPPHSATNDTIVTLRLLDALIRKHCDTAPDEESLKIIQDTVDAKKKLLLRERAKGFISLVKNNKVYKIKNNRKRPAVADFVIEVEDRFKAEDDLRDQFARREVKPDSYLYRLRPDDIDCFLAYSNTYDDLESTADADHAPATDSDNETDTSHEIDDNTDDSPADLSALQALQAKFSRR